MKKNIETKLNQLAEWEYMNPSYRLERDEYFISYNPGNYLIPEFAGDKSDETAIVVGSKYYILNGDFRVQYQNCETLEQCLKIFKDNKELHSTWSNDLDDDSE